MNQQAYINRYRFITEFNKMREHNHITIANVVHGTPLSRSYIYHLLSTNENRKVTYNAAKKIGQGLKLSSSQQREWDEKVLNSSADVDDDSFRPLTVITSEPPQVTLASVVKKLMKKNNITKSNLVNNSNLNEHYVNSFFYHGLKLKKIEIARLARSIGTNYQDLMKLWKDANTAKPSSHHKNSVKSDSLSSVNTLKKRKSVQSQHTSDGLSFQTYCLAKRIDRLSNEKFHILRFIVDLIIDSWSSK